MKDDFPPEVYEALIIGYRKYVSTKLYHRYLEIIEKYSKYFPQEYKYHFIVPKEVHDAYNKDITKHHSRYFSEGISQGIKENSPMIGNFELTRKDLEGLVSAVLNQRSDKRKERKIWDKHYKKYGLKYEGGEYS